MDIDGYDGSELAPIHENEEPLDTSALDTSALDNSLTANVDQMFDITKVETNDNLNNMGNQLEDNSTERYVENMNNEKENFVENMDNSTTTEVKMDKKTMNTMAGLGIFLIVWIIIGIIAFIVSLFCFGFSGSMTEKIIGLLLAIFFGPFYFIYFYLNKNYCGKQIYNVKSD